MSKIQKALDLNKLYSDQKQGRLLKKHLKFPLYAGTKYDGNYSVIIVACKGDPVFISSGGHVYTNNHDTIFHHSDVGVYLVERIGTNGKLGDRTTCALRGTRGMQEAVNHSYRIFDYLTIPEYNAGLAFRTYSDRRKSYINQFEVDPIVEDMLIHDHEELDRLLENVVKQGYEGLMLKDPNWFWKDTKSRTIDCVKYKKRPTADLLVVGATEGTGKYEGMIGSLRLQDSKGRIVDVGSGMSDEDRLRDPSYFIMNVVEVFYEQILDTYIQPTFGTEYDGVLVRGDKTVLDID